MAVELVSELGGAGAIRLPRARAGASDGLSDCVPRSRRAVSDRRGHREFPARIHKTSLTTWGWTLVGESAPTDPPLGREATCRGVAAIDDPGLPEVRAELAAAWPDEADADTVNREPCIVSKAIGRWRRQGTIEHDPTLGIEWRPTPRRTAPALSRNQIAALGRPGVWLREKTPWQLLYDSAARADEVPCLNVEDLCPQDERAGITAKGGAPSGSSDIEDLGAKRALVMPQDPCGGGGRTGFGIRRRRPKGVGGPRSQEVALAPVPWTTTATAKTVTARKNPEGWLSGGLLVNLRCPWSPSGRGPHDGPLGAVAYVIPIGPVRRVAGGGLRGGGLPRPVPMPEPALVLTVIPAGDRPLTGPPPAEALGPVPHADLVRPVSRASPTSWLGCTATPGTSC
ncbi:hypothetical protein [Streptomyces vinaceus]|uniref:hypothetical protein n=1 Tax=Streptomyces vinaceus TaxID=1960 RepID=UPI0036CED48A